MNGNKLREIPLPSGEFHKKFGEIKNNGNGTKVFRPNLKTISAIVTLSLLLLGGIAKGAIWIHGQSTGRVDTTKAITVLKDSIKKHIEESDTVDSEIIIIQEASRDMLKDLIREILKPEKAEPIIRRAEEQEERMMKRLVKKRNEDSNE